MKPTDSKVNGPTMPKPETEAKDSVASNSQSPDARIQYLIECFRAAHEEGMFRIQKRDKWLQYQLLVQVGLLSLARGLEITGVKASSPYPDVLVLSSAASAVFVTLYLIENSLVGNLSRYVASLSEIEAKLSGKAMIPNWDASQNYIGNYIKDTLPFRFVAQLMSFLLIPMGITIFRLVGVSHRRSVLVAEAFLHAGLFAYVLFIIVLNYKRRARNAENLGQLNNEMDGPPLHDTKLE
jgi:dolichyl-phosphate-mannose--protein O-mannosyl transferase